MTTRQLRDIAAYFPNGNLTFHLLQDLANGDVPNFKLRLRKLESLTDDEVIECAKLDAGGEFRYGGVYSIKRWPTHITTLYGNGAHFSIQFDTFIDEECFSYNIISIIAYLQSIGVWVPGTIDEEFVELIEL